VVGHKDPARDDDPTRPITDTRHYLDDVEELHRERADPVAFFDPDGRTTPRPPQPHHPLGSALAFYSGR